MVAPPTTTSTGGAGDDRLYLGSGHNVPSGGTEADTFSFGDHSGADTSHASPDRIIDFVSTEGEKP